MSPSQGIVSFRQPFRPNRMEPTPFAVAPGGYANFPTMRFQPVAPGSSEDDSVKKEAKLHFAKVLSDIKHLPKGEAQSGEEDDFVEDDSIEKDAVPRLAVHARSPERMEAATPTIPAKASPSKEVSDGKKVAADLKPNGGEGQEAICAVVIEIIKDDPFMTIVPVAAHVHGDHIDKEVDEVIAGDLIFPIAEVIGVGPCKELAEQVKKHQHGSQEPINRHYAYWK